MNRKLDNNISPRLGVNIDHVATLRNARDGSHPDILRAAEEVLSAGGDSITIHLREDRRHIIDSDVINLINKKILPINLEIAATEEMVLFAIKNSPRSVCIVPEKREEITTEGGLDVKSKINQIKPIVERLADCGIKVSLFIEPDESQIIAVSETKASAVELHTGTFCNKIGKMQSLELNKIIAASKNICSLGLECHAGHGLNFENVSRIAAIENIVELNIGHFLIGESIFLGLKDSIKKMKLIINDARLNKNKFSS